MNRMGTVLLCLFLGSFASWVGAIIWHATAWSKTHSRIATHDSFFAVLVTAFLTVTLGILTRFFIERR